ncbi:hypothetical protein JCM11641_005446 [Rhodosporidiobolus odoratus]
MASVFSSARLAAKTVLIASPASLLPFPKISLTSTSFPSPPQTGASGGIGAATAILFARAGANLILTARRQAQLDQVATAAKQAFQEGGSKVGGKVATLTLDMTDREAVKGVLSKVPEELRAVDILVNNAGLVFGTDKVGDIDDAELETMFQTNVLGLIHLTQIFVKEFKARESGHIINLSSIAGQEPYIGGSIYCATKHAVQAFNDSLRRELVGWKGIRVTSISPGMVETNFSVTRFRGDKSKADAVYQGLQPLVAEDIAEEIVWAASRPPHVQIADVLVFPSEQASATVNSKNTPK